MYFRNDFIIKEIEAVCDCDVLAIGFSETPLAIKGNIFSISSQHFLEWIKEIDRIRSRGNGAIGRVKSNFISNDIAKKTGGKTTELRYGRNVDSKYITHMTNNDLSDDDAEILIQSMVEQASNSNVLKEKIPALKRKIEIASLDTLIEHFQAELPKSHSEGYWQSFFEANLFALQQILSTPFTLITPHAHVETGGLLGNGAKITDYFGKNPVSSNVCIIEIKKPTTRLINKSRYREGLYAASKELSGSIVQITDQANSFVSDIYKHKSQNPSLEIEAHNILKCILIGNTDEFGNDKGMLKSFELYRQTCANVDIVTYNEALEQLKILRAFLISESE